MLTLTEVNNLDFEKFIEILGNVVEHCPVLAAGLWSHRPFQNFEDLVNKIKAIIYSLPPSGTFAVTVIVPYSI